MKWVFFIFIEIIFIIFIRKVLVFFFFSHFPKKIKISIKKGKFAPYINNKKVKKIIENYNFKYVGVRKESIFKVFYLKYHLFKNDNNVYLDLTMGQKFYFISFLKGQINYIYLSPTKQFKSYKEENFVIEIIDKVENIIQIGDPMKRVELSENFYKLEKSPFSKASSFVVYPIIAIFLAQFIYFILKYLI